MLALHHWNKPTPLAQVVPDGTWSGMWRIKWPDGELSDMVNLARAKDAAKAIAARKLSTATRNVSVDQLRWRQTDSGMKEGEETAPQAAPMR